MTQAPTPTETALAPPKDLDPLSVNQALRGRKLLVLGGTGFLGKVWLSMLLHRYPDVGHIYLMVRPKGKMDAEARFWAEIATSPTFDPLRELYPGDQLRAFLSEKITPLAGDISNDDLGFSAEAVAEMTGNLAALVNASGLVDFNPPIDEAIHANAFGIRNIVALARKLGDVPVFHTSTTYVAGGRNGLIPEQDPREYPFPRANELDRSLWSPEREIAECVDLVEMARHRANDAFRQTAFLDEAKQNLLDRNEPTRGKALEDELGKVKRRFIRKQLSGFGVERAQFWGWSNTYTYTKSIGEQILLDSGLPVTIGRPSVIESSIEYPFPGWNEGINTSAPWIYLAVKGHVQYPCKGGYLDVIPVDMVAAAMIAHLAALIEDSHPPVCQYCSGDVNPCSMERFIELFGLAKRRRYRAGTGNPILDYLQANFEPVAVDKATYERQGAGALGRYAKGVAGVLDKLAIGPLKGGAKAAAKATRSYASVAEMTGGLMEVFIPFTHDFVYEFRADKTRELFQRMPSEDRDKLPWYPETIDWRDWFLEIHAPALEKWVEPLMDDKLKRTRKPARAFENLWEFLDEMAERHDLLPALQRLEGDTLRRLSYRDIRDEALQVAAALAASGVKPGDRVVVSGKNHPRWPICNFGVLRAGATVVPVDPEMELTAFTNVIRSAKAKFVLCDAGVAERLAEAEQAEWQVLDLLGFGLEHDAGAAPKVDIKGSDVASLIFTSGTTGAPKGVMLSHENFTQLVSSLVPLFPLGPRDSSLSVLPLHHTFEFTCGLLLPMSRGTRITYLDELNGDQLSKALKQAKISAMVGVPALWQLLERRIRSQVEERGKAAQITFDLAGTMSRLIGKKAGLDAGRMLFGQVHQGLGGNLRYLVSGGAALPSSTHEFFQNLGLHLAEGYGLTEAAPVLTVAQGAPGVSAGHVGKPIPGVEVKIDAPNDKGVGEILARGPNVMQGYADRPDATAEVLTEDGWLRTGDLGSIDRKGRLSIVGREKDVVVTASGENVYPDEVEELLGEIEHVEELSVLGVPLDSGGEQLACIAVPKEGSGDHGERRALAEDSLRKALRNLPKHQKPTLLHIYDAPLPRTATRKVKRKECQAILERIERAVSIRPGELVAGGASEVRTILATVSGKKAADITGSTRLAADLGIDSLSAVELVAALDVMASKAGRPPVDGDKVVQCETVSELERLLRKEPVARSKTQEIHGDVPTWEDVDVPAPLLDAAKGWMGRMQMGFYRRGMRTRVKGRAFIPQNRPTIVVANHTSHLDMGVVKYALGAYGEKLITLGAQDYFFDGWRKFYFENMTNVVPMERHAGLRESLNRAGDILRRGETLLLFPEGTRSQSGSMADFKPGVGYLALEHERDILPVYIDGAYESWPKGQRVPTKRKLGVSIGPPLSIHQLREKVKGMRKSEAAKVVALAAQLAVEALKAGKVFDLDAFDPAVLIAKPKAHPLVELYTYLETQFVPNKVEKETRFYFSLGNEPEAKWTVAVKPDGCMVKQGKLTDAPIDCVVKTSPHMMERIIREGYIPPPPEFMAGKIKSNRVEMLFTFVESFGLSG